MEAYTFPASMLCGICPFFGVASWIWYLLPAAEYEYQEHAERIAGYTGRSGHAPTVRNAV